MIESMNLIDLYVKNKEKNIKENRKNAIEEARKKDEVIKKYRELCEKFKLDLDELYLSQFNEEEKKKIITEHGLYDGDKQLIKEGPMIYSYCANGDFMNDDCIKIEEKYEYELQQLYDFGLTVRAHIGIAKNKEEVEEILTRYGIIDKKGKLVIE